MDPDQILWEATYPQYLQTVFLFFQNFQFSNFYDFFFIFPNTGPYGSKNFQNATPPPFFFFFHPIGPNFMIN